MRFNVVSQVVEPQMNHLDQLVALEGWWNMLAESEAIEGCVPFVVRDEFIHPILGDDPASWQNNLEGAIVAAQEGLITDIFNGTWWKGLTFSRNSDKAAAQIQDILNKKPTFSGKDAVYSDALPPKSKFDTSVKNLEAICSELGKAVKQDMTKYDPSGLISVLDKMGIKVKGTKVEGTPYQYKSLSIDDILWVAGVGVSSATATTITLGATTVTGILLPVALFAAGVQVTGRARANTDLFDEGWKESDFEPAAKKLLALHEQVNGILDMTGKKIGNEELTPEEKEKAMFNAKLLNAVAKVLNAAHAVLLAGIKAVMRQYA